MGAAFAAGLLLGGATWLVLHRRRPDAERDTEVFAQAYHRSVLGVAMVDRKGRFLLANPAFCDMVGCTEAQLQSMSFRDITFPDDLEKSESYFEDFAAGRIDAYTLEKRYQCIDGSVLWVKLRCTSLSRDDDRWRGLAVVEDITGARRQKEELESSRRKYRGLFESMVDMVFLHEIRGDHLLGPFVEVNQAACDRLGYTQEQFRQMWPRDLEALKPGQSVVDTLRHDGHVIFEHAMKSADGEIVPVEIHASTVTYGDQDVVLSVARDLTYRRDAESRVDRLQRETRMLLDTTPAGIWYKDRHNRILRCNRTAAESIRMTVEQVEGKTLEELMPDEAEQMYADDCRVFESGEPLLGIVEPMTSGDEKIWIRTDKIPIRDNEDNVTGVLIFTQDVTQARQMEQQLRQSQKMDAVGQLAGGIAHDFNNMLSPIEGFADLLKANLPDRDKLWRYADSIQRAARRCANLTAQLLAFARKGQYVSVPVNLHRLIAEVVSLLGHTIDKRIEIRQHLDASPATSKGDPNQFQNMLLNLALNAAQAMPEGGVLTFSTGIVEVDDIFRKNFPGPLGEGSYLQLEVADTGMGMDRETQKHIFEPFFTTKPKGQGTGMGLASVYGIVRNHNGGITFHSEPGHGTSFKVLLPLAGDAEDEKDECESDELVRGAASVMLADDEPMIREMAAEMLSDMGHSVRTFADGQEALDYYRDHWGEVDLVILDQMMPRMGGNDTYLAMRRINPDVRVLLASGYSLDGQAQAMLDEGVLGFVQKPFDMSDLSHAVADALATQPATDPSTE